VDKAQSRWKQLKKQLEESEDEVSRHNASKRKLQRELEEQTEAYETAQRDADQLRSKLRGAGVTGSSRLSIDHFQFTPTRRR